MHVLKFGGTSMSDEHSWRQVLDIITRYECPFVIVSATAKTTRQLLSAAEKALHDKAGAEKTADAIGDRHLQLIANFLEHYPQKGPAAAKECEQWIEEKVAVLKGCLSQINRKQKLEAPLKDAVASIGEQLSSYLFAKCGAVFGLSTKWVDAAGVIRTSSDFEQASPDTDFIYRRANYLSENMQAGQIPIMGGYYGQDEKGNITTLGFEGSDYTASLIGAALSAEAIEIWTDVSGIYTCDPRAVPKAKPIPGLNFREATELAYFGAKVLHPSTTKPASQSGIPILVKNIFEPDQPGTRIASESAARGRAKAMAFKEGCAVLTVTSANTVMGYKFLSGVFQILKKHRLAVDVVTTTEASVSIALEDGTQTKKAIDQLKRQGVVEVKGKQAVISLVGCNMGEISSLTNDVLKSIDSKALNLISFSRTKGNLNVVLNQDSVLASVKEIHKRIFE